MAKKPCDCKDESECYGDYTPKGVKCRDLPPADPGHTFGPDMPDLSDDELDEMELRCGKD